MKTNNWIVFSLFAVGSLATFAFWYAFGLKLDSTWINLALIVAWWVVIAACMYVVYREGQEDKEPRKHQG